MHINTCQRLVAYNVSKRKHKQTKMDLAPLFTTSKWEILERISESPESPTQLSTNLKTSPANISQQVRLLEIAGLINKTKIHETETGKPKTLFSVNNNFSYIISVSNEGAQKKLMKTDKIKRLLLNAWMIGNKKVEDVALELSTKGKDLLAKISFFIFSPSENSFIISGIEKKSKAENKLASILKTFGFSYKVLSENNLDSYLKPEDGQILIIEDHLKKFCAKTTKTAEKSS